MPSPAVDGSLSDEPLAVPATPQARQSVFLKAYNGVAFVLSALLSPYIVIPVGTVGIVFASSPHEPKRLLWAALSVFFSTVVPALYVVLGIWRGKITDVHVMERQQRFGPFFVAVISSLISAVLLWKMGAPLPVWSLSVVIAVNGLVLWTITSFYKISIHVSVLAAVVLAAVTLHPGFQPHVYLWLIPALIWARSTRKRHTLWQGLSGCIVACFITATTLIALDMGDSITRLLQRLVTF